MKINHIKVNNTLVTLSQALSISTLIDNIDSFEISYIVVNNSEVYITLVGREAFTAKIMGYDAYIERLYSNSSKRVRDHLRTILKEN